MGQFTLCSNLPSERASQPKSKSDSKKEAIASVQPNLGSDTSSFFHILFIRSKLLSPAHTQGEGSLARQHQIVEITGAISAAAYHRNSNESPLTSKVAKTC
jgi:hypothetical protein